MKILWSDLNDTIKNLLALFGSFIFWFLRFLVVHHFDNKGEKNKKKESRRAGGKKKLLHKLKMEGVEVRKDRQGENSEHDSTDDC